MTRILVTGSLGWLGRRLIESLASGTSEVPAARALGEDLTVRALVEPGQSSQALKELLPEIEIATGDLREPADCAEFCASSGGAILLHAAGIIHPRRVADYYGINVAGTKTLLAAAKRADVRRVVVVSSNSPCGVNANAESTFDEESPYRPYMNYGRSKMLMEQAALETYQSGDLEVVIVRPPWFYGPCQPARQTLFFRMIRNGTVPIVGSGENRRSMAYIDNLCQGLLLAATSERANGQIYWIADERPYSMNEIVATIERLLESEFDQSCAHRRRHLPDVASKCAWLVDAGLQRVGLYHQKIHVLSEMNKTIACSVEKAKRELGYAPTIALEEGMRRSLRWVFDHYGGLD
jgi:nucleoside-diphosphate-sugar epimerase